MDFLTGRKVVLARCDCLKWNWSCVDYLCIKVMLLSAVWTLILTAPIHCRRSIGEQEK